MYGKNISEVGKRVAGGGMSTIALQEALKWHDELMDAFDVHRRQKESAIRADLSKQTGVRASYLFRLAYKRREMRDVAGEAYRLLNLAHAKYVRACERIEESAEAMRQERMNLKAKQGNADAQSHRDMAVGVVETQVTDGDRPRGLGASR